MKYIINKLDKIGVQLFKQYGSDSYGIRCELHDLKKQLEALNIHDVSATLKDKETLTFKEWLFTEGYTRQGNFYIKHGVKYYESKLIEEYNELVMNI